MYQGAIAVPSEVAAPAAADRGVADHGAVDRSRGAAVTSQAAQSHSSTHEGERAKACTVRQVLDRVGGKWSIGVLVEASQGPVRFTELERSVEGISRRMLTLTLRNLERDGLLVRTVYPTIPPKVEYRATEMALELYDTLVALTGWAERHREAISVARERYDRERGDDAALD